MHICIERFASHPFRQHVDFFVYFDAFAAQGDLSVSCCARCMVAERGIIGNDSRYPSRH